MKIKTTALPYEQVIVLPPWAHQPPLRPNWFFRTLLKLVSIPDLLATGFTCEKSGMERLGKNEPCLVLMNHSSFIDLKIAMHLLYPRPVNIVCTSDGFVGKEWLMRHIGCIPTNKFVNDLLLVRDLRYALHTLKNTVLLFPEASYSFDGTATPLPESLGKCVKLLKVPVIMIRTHGAFTRDPLYNGLQLRKVRVSAEINYLLSPEEIAGMTVEELNRRLAAEFTFDNFRWQQENRIRVPEPFRADGLERVLYQCPHCGTEGRMEGKGIHLTCHACGKEYTLTEYGRLEALDGDSAFTHVPDWYQWEREEVRRQLAAGTYAMDLDVDIGMLVDSRAIYKVGAGHLHHDKDGFRLTGCDGQMDYIQKPQASYSLYADYFWYEIGDMICIGDRNALYYCFPKTTFPVAKARIAAEELYKMAKSR